MKTRRLFVMALTLCASFPTVAVAQELPTGWVIRLTYVKFNAAGYEDYVRRYWKPIQQERVDRGMLVSWRVYRVGWPNGETQDYHYVIMDEFSSFAHLAASLDNPDSVSDPRAITGEPQREQRHAAPPAMGERTDTLVVVAATENWSKASNLVLEICYLRSLPGKGDYLAMLQRDHVIPSMEAVIKDGAEASLATARLRFPEERGFPYDYVSFAGYANLAQIDKQAVVKWRGKWGDCMPTESNAQLDAVRKRVKVELWWLVDQTTGRGGLRARVLTDSVLQRDQ